MKTLSGEKPTLKTPIRQRDRTNGNKVLLSKNKYPVKVKASDRAIKGIRFLHNGLATAETFWTIPVREKHLVQPSIQPSRASDFQFRWSVAAEGDTSKSAIPPPRVPLHLPFRVHRHPGHRVPIGVLDFISAQRSLVVIGEPIKLTPLALKLPRRGL